MLQLKQVRKERHMTRKELAAKIGFTEQAIYMYETGRRKPDYDMVIRLSEILDCSVEELMGTKIPEEERSFTPADKVLFDAANGATEEEKMAYARLILAMRGK